MSKYYKYASLTKKAKGISSKDWQRMLDLVLSGKEGSGIARTIKNKDKAIARFIAGLKLSGEDLKYSGQSYWSDFGKFGDKALELGATQEEIQKIFDKTIVPKEILDKKSALKSKKLGNRFVGEISKLVLKLGYDIKFLSHNGYAITNEGKNAMSRNGRKWTIGYKTEITKDDKSLELNFDAITDEGGGITSYVIANSDILQSLVHKSIGLRNFLSDLKNELESK